MRLTDDPMRGDLEKLRDIELDELAVRRVRDRLRTWANDRRYAALGEDRWRVRVMAAGFVVLVVVLGVGIWQRRSEPVAPQPLVSEPLQKIDLSDGKLHLDIDLSTPAEANHSRPPEHRRVASTRAPVQVEALQPQPLPEPAPIAEREDALYLSLIHALRAGRTDEARDLGLEYLRAFPDGFRRAEVVRLVSHASN